jgi:23S rRNA pseudouridine1911/1915/1917 synthase
METVNYIAGELEPLVLFADNHLLAVNKPAGLLSQDSGTGLRNLEDWAREWVRVDKGKPGNVFLNAVHRIDRAVSGVVLFARTSKALSRLNEDVRKRNCRKIYHALVEGKPPQPAGELVHWLTHEHHRADVCREGDQGAQRAVLRYRIIRMEGRPPCRPGTEQSPSLQRSDLTLLEIDLETGRYHQIRAQLSAIGCPIAGDEKYGAKTGPSESGIALHHRRLEISHPTLREQVIIEAPYPPGSTWWKDLR